MSRGGLLERFGTVETGLLTRREKVIDAKTSELRFEIGLLTSGSHGSTLA